MAPDTQISSGMRAHLLSVLIGTLGALAGYALATLAGIFILQDGLNDILGDVNLFATAMFCCYGWPVLLVCGLVVGLPASLLGGHFHWRQAITNVFVLVVSVVLGVVSALLLNALGLFSFIALGGME